MMQTGGETLNLENDRRYNVFLQQRLGPQFYNHNQNLSIEDVGNAGTRLLALILFPNAASDAQLQLLAVSTGKEERHVSLHYEAVMAVSYFPMAVSDTSRGAFPNHSPATAPDFEAVAVGLCLILIPHETDECHVNWSLPEQKGFKVQAEIFSKTIEHL
jgi:hypothetical protein